MTTYLNPGTSRARKRIGDSSRGILRLTCRISGLGLALPALASMLLAALSAMDTQAAEYTYPRALAVGDTYVLIKDAHTGDEGTTQPKTDANDGLNGDNPYYRRHNVARAHNDYWYTSAYQNADEPSPTGPQWVEYAPPLTILGPGRYRILAEYRYTSSRATYAVPYIVTRGDGTTSTTWRVQSDQGTTYVTFSLGEHDLGATGTVRVEDRKQDGTWGARSITFNKMKFTYLGPTDTQAPTVPTNVTATALNAVSIRVDWTASTDNVGVTGYRIFRDGVQVGTSTTTSYTDTGLAPQTTYSYTVSAHDAAGNNSAQSSPATATTPVGDDEPPSVPTDVTAMPQSAFAILITWTASTDNVGVTGYTVYRDGTAVGTAADTSYTDTGLNPSTTYAYTVTAHDAMGNTSVPSSPPVLATTFIATTVTLMQDNFDNSNIDSRWDVKSSSCSVAAPGTVYHKTDSNACGTPAGYAYRPYNGDRCMIWKNPFTTANHVNIMLTFWYWNDAGGSIETRVLRNGSWTLQGTVTSTSGWTKQEYPLTGTITGIRFDLKGSSNINRAIDCISITGTPPAPPTINVHPEHQIRSVGQTATFSVTALDADAYQWRMSDGSDWGNIGGAIHSSYTTPALTAADDGQQYLCVVSNAFGSIVSDPATLTVVPRPYAIADFDEDGDVDLKDFGLLQRCFNASSVSGDCVPADLNNDGVVNQTDFTIFRSCLSGANIPADPACGLPG